MNKKLMTTTQRKSISEWFEANKVNRHTFIKFGKTSTHVFICYRTVTGRIEHKFVGRRGRVIVER